MSETKPIPEYRDQENQDRHGSHPHGVYISKKKQKNLVKLFLKKLHIVRCYEEMKQEISIENYRGWKEKRPTLHRVESKCFIKRVILKLRLKNEKELTK